MPRTPANITQADINRAIRAAKAAGLDEVKLQFGKDATITLPLKGIANKPEEPEIEL